MQRNMHVVGGACYVPVVLKGARTRGVYLCTLRTRHAIPADALPAAAAHGAEQLQHVHRLVWDSLLTCNCLRGVSRWFTPLACGPGSPELSKSNLDMASKLFTFTLHAQGGIHDANCARGEGRMVCTRGAARRYRSCERWRRYGLGGRSP